MSVANWVIMIVIEMHDVSKLGTTIIHVLVLLDSRTNLQVLQDLEEFAFL